MIIEVEVRADGRRYPVGGVLAKPERWRVIRLEHQLHCAQQLSFRQTQAALVARGIRRSLGQLAKDLARYACDICDPPGGEPAAAPQQQPSQPADRQQPAPPGGGWAGPAPAW